MFGIVDSNQKIIGTNLELHIDAAQRRSYPTTGTTWTDLSGNGRNAVLSNTTFNTTNGGSISFNGTSSTGSFSPISLWNASSNHTISVWFYRPTSPTGNIICFQKGGLQGWRILINSHQYAQNVELSQNYDSFPSGFVALGVDVWYNFSVVRSGSLFSIYRNDVLVRTGSYTGNNITSTDILYLGIRGEANDQYFNGRIAQILWYNTPFTATQISHNFRANLSRYSSSLGSSS